MRRPRRLAGLIVSTVLILGGAVPVLPAGPAGAHGGLTLGLELYGTLPTFPCGGSCRTTFSGLMKPAGVATVGTGTIRIPGVTDVPGTGYTATFAMSSGTVTGWADYNEPALPLCPVKGTAAGRVEVFAPAEGVVRHSSNPTAVGEIDSVYLTANFTYDRVGSTAAIVARTGGWMRVYFHWLDTGANGTFDQFVYAAGSGVFNVNPVQAAEACLNGGGRLDYQVNAEVAALTTTPSPID